MVRLVSATFPFNIEDLRCFTACGELVCLFREDVINDALLAAEAVRSAIRTVLYPQINPVCRLDLLLPLLVDREPVAPCRYMETNPSSD